MLFESIVYTLIFSLSLADFDENLLFCKTPPPKLTNGLINRDRVSYYKGKGYLGNMEYTCLPGFHHVGNKTVICQNGIWSTMVQCIPDKRCSPIRIYPANTKMESSNIAYFQNDPRQIIVGSTITLRCMDNFELDPDSTGSLTVQCQNGGIWTPMPSCRSVQSMCDYSKLYLPHRSSITRMNLKFSEGNQRYHLVGSSLEYTCEDGYRLKDGRKSLTVECLSSGVWSPLPICEHAQIKAHGRCSYPTSIQNGFLTLYNVTIWEDQTYTGSIGYECNYGFETVHGSEQIISECVNGNWTNIYDCHEIPTCSKQELLEIEARTENSYVHNVSLQYIRNPLAFIYNSYVLRVCLPNFEHDPSSPSLKIQCQRTTNTWTGIPICRALQTTTQMTTKNNEDNLETDDDLLDSKEDSTINLSINQFRTTTPTSPETSTIIETTHTISCNAEDIPYIPHAVVIQSEFYETYNVGTNLFFTCRPGYQSPPEQAIFITCYLDGTWSADKNYATVCQMTVDTTQSILFDTSTVSSTKTEEPSNNADFDQDLPIMNISTGTIFSFDQPKSTSSNRQSREINSNCNELPIIEHAQLISDDTIKSVLDNSASYTGSVVFACQHGFINNHTGNETFRLTCENGIFHPTVICIEKPRCPLPPPIDSTRSAVIDSLINVFDTSTNEAIPGSFVLLNCFNLTHNERFTFNMTCLDHGEWLLPPPICTARFRRRCQSGITIPNARTNIYAKLTADGYYDDGSRASYRCLENFIHDPQSGPLHIQCRNGRWGPRPKCIPSGCLQSLPDTIENGWKSAESYVIYDEVKYYLLARYSCRENAAMVDSSSNIKDISCRNNQWQHESLPVCQLKE